MNYNKAKKLLETHKFHFSVVPFHNEFCGLMMVFATITICWKAIDLMEDVNTGPWDCGEGKYGIRFFI